MIKNIILDMGNVLLRFDPEIPLGVYLDNDTDRAIIRTALFDHPDWEKADRGDFTNEQRYQRALCRIPIRLHEAYRKCALHWHICLEYIPGAKAFIDEMKHKGYRLYVLSNADDTFHSYFPARYDTGLFDGIMISSDVKMIKPQRDIYAHFLSQYGLTAAESLFIDDRPQNVAGAKAVGIHGFLFQGDFDAVRQQYQL